MVSSASATPPGLARAALTGACAVLVGIGLARFAYTPLLPALVTAGWFGPAEAAYLGAANLAGYLAGAGAGRRQAGRPVPAALLRGLMVLAAACFAACALPLSFGWMFFWRFCSGLAGGGLVVLAAPLLIARLPLASRGLASGLIFTGVGLGIISSGTLVPLLVRHGLSETWLGLAAVSLLLTAVAWPGWRNSPGIPALPAPPAGRSRELRRWLPFYTAYALNAVGMVPHMTFLADYVARGLGQGVAAGAETWVVFGLGAAVGPLSGGMLGGRLGFRPALRLAFAAQALATALPVLAAGGAAVTLSAFLMGACTPGIAPIVLGRCSELAGGDPRRMQAAWGTATITFAVVQAATAFVFSALFERVGYVPLFAVATVALVAALLVDLAGSRRP